MKRDLQSTSVSISWEANSAKNNSHVLWKRMADSQDREKDTENDSQETGLGLIELTRCSHQGFKIIMDW